MAEKIFWGEMTRWELKERAESVDTALLPVGSLEQHGPHLPLDTDAYDAGYMLEKAVEKLSSPKPPILPTIPYGVSHHHMYFPGTVTLRNETLEMMIIDIGRSIISSGFQKLFIYNAHGGNTDTINIAAKKLKKETGLFVLIDSGESMEPGKKELVESRNDVHAGEYETSTSMANRGELVKEKMIPEESSKFPHETMEFDHEPPFHFVWDTHELTDTGVLGDPGKASEEKGEELWERGISKLAERIEIAIELTPPFTFAP
ncbi:MAG: creatininase family protein [Thermoplasmatota archaeon]